MPAALLAAFLACLRFYTRLPVPALRIEAAHPPEPFARCLAFAPLAGAAVGLVGAGTLALALGLGLPTLPAGALAVLALALVGGGLHEDGLADVADGFGGGRSRTRKLEIMRDSRLGSYGALALVFSILIRAAAVGALAERGGAATAAAALVAAAAASRGIGLLPLAVLPPARADGLGRGAGRLPPAAFAAALALSAVLGLAVPALAGVGPGPSARALALALAAAAGAARLARRQVGGFTGDVAGAAQQLCEAAMLLGLLAAPGGS